MRWLRRLYGLFGEGRFEAEMTEAMRLPIELQTELNPKAGMDPEEARYAALRLFGNVASLQERARTQRFGPAVEQLDRDPVDAIRQCENTRARH